MGFSLRLRGELESSQLEGAMAGELDSGERLHLLSCEPSGGEAANRWYQVQAIGANGRDLRALFERQGAVVSRILRVQFGSLHLDRELPRGQVRPLESEELQQLLAEQAVAVPAGDEVAD